MLRLSELKAAMAMRAALGYGPGDALCTDKSGPPPILRNPNYNPRIRGDYRKQEERGSSEPTAAPLEHHLDERTGLPYYSLPKSQDKKTSKPRKKRE